VAVLTLSGVMAPKANLFMRISGGVSTRMATEQVRSMRADPRVRSAILAVDSPGGSVFGVPALAEEVRLLAAEKKMGRPGMGHNGGPDLQAEAKQFTTLARAHAAAFRRDQPGDIDAEATQAYKAGYRAFLKSGDRALEAAELKAMAVGSDPEIDALVARLNEIKGTPGEAFSVIDTSDASVTISSTSR
jgi:hypothetical protein